MIIIYLNQILMTSLKHSQETEDKREMSDSNGSNNQQRLWKKPTNRVNKGQGYKSKSTTSNSLLETNFTTLDEAEYIRYYRQNHKNSNAKILSNILKEMNQEIGELKPDSDYLKWFHVIQTKMAQYRFS